MFIKQQPMANPVKVTEEKIRRKSFVANPQIICKYLTKSDLKNGFVAKPRNDHF